MSALSLSTGTTVAADVATWNCEMVIGWSSSVVLSQKDYSQEIRANSLGGKSLLSLKRYVSEGKHDMAHRLLEKAGILALGDQLSILEALPDLHNFKFGNPELKRLNDFDERDQLIQNPLVRQLGSSRASLRADGFQRSRVKTLDRENNGFHFKNPAFSHGEDEQTIQHEERGTATRVQRLSAPRWSINQEELDTEERNSIGAALPGFCGVVLSTLFTWSKHLRLVAYVLAFVIWYEINMWIGFFFTSQTFPGKYVLTWLAYLPAYSIAYFVYTVRTYHMSCHFSAETRN
jgi:hypothetical protein